MRGGILRKPVRDSAAGAALDIGAAQDLGGVESIMALTNRCGKMKAFVEHEAGAPPYFDGQDFIVMYIVGSCLFHWWEIGGKGETPL